MSGKPYPEGVSKIIEALEELEKVNKHITYLTPLVDELKGAKARRNDLSVEVANLLSSMDLESQGNFGFGGRMGWFVEEMRLQLLAKHQRLLDSA
jgi:hypothetical protein